MKKVLDPSLLRMSLKVNTNNESTNRHHIVYMTTTVQGVVVEICLRALSCYQYKNGSDIIVVINWTFLKYKKI